MPQMFEYCGKRFKVYKRAHKTCDTVNPIVRPPAQFAQFILNFVAMARPTAAARQRA